MAVGDRTNLGIFTFIRRRVLFIHTLINIFLYDLYLKNAAVLFLDINQNFKTSLAPHLNQ